MKQIHILAVVQWDAVMLLHCLSESYSCSIMPAVIPEYNTNVIIATLYFP